MSDIRDPYVLKKEFEQELSAKEKSVKLLLKQESPVFYWAREYHINTRGERMRFADQAYLVHLYKDFHKYHKFVAKKSVQGGGSELCIVCALYEAGELGLTVFYVLPKYELRNRFVSNRIDKTIRKVRKYSELLKEGGGAARLALKHFGKGTIAFIGSNVESEFVEMPVDSAYVDEKDRCNRDNLLLLPDRLTASPYKFEREISNPTIEGVGIDSRYQSSTMGEWHIRCDHCSNWLNLDFFKHVVRQVDEHKWTALDTNWVYAETEACIICDKCHKPVNRLKNGEWIEAFPRREWKGVHLHKLPNPRVSIGRLVDKWVDWEPSPIQKQIFYNSDLGLAYSSEGAKFSEYLLNSCQREYDYPVERKNVNGLVFMGVDVGSELNIVIRERIKVDNEWVRRLCLVIRVPSFTLLAQLLQEWRPRVVVIDAFPEIHKVAELKDEFKQVYSSRFVHLQPEMHVDKNERVVTMDRTAIIDALRGEFDREYAVLPMDACHIDSGVYYEQMQASTRILEINEKHPDKSFFKWTEEGSPDHFMLAEAYCLQADLITPRDSIIDYYSQFTQQITDENTKKIEEIAKQTNSNPLALQQFSQFSPTSFLNQLQNKHIRK